MQACPSSIWSRKTGLAALPQECLRSRRAEMGTCSTARMIGPDVSGVDPV